MRVLVVGGAGYIGSHTALALAEAGHDPVVYDNLEMGHEWAVQWGPLIKGDLNDGELLRKTLIDYRIDAVIHFAAFIFVGESVGNPRKYFQNNLCNTLNLLNAMLDCGVRNIVFSSSCAVYGNPRYMPLDEEHPQEPINPYGDSKQMAERILHWYGQAYGLSWVAMRYFNASGADPEGRIGESHDPETHLIPLAIDAAMGRSGPIRLFGTDYPTADGTAVRDYVHVLDLAEAHVLALSHLSNGGKSHAFNIGSGAGYSVREVMQSIERVSGTSVPCEESPRREGDPPELLANASKAMHMLGWRRKYVDLDEIVRTAWNWHARDTGGEGHR